MVYTRSRSGGSSQARRVSGKRGNVPPCQAAGPSLWHWTFYQSGPALLSSWPCVGNRRDSGTAATARLTWLVYIEEAMPVLCAPRMIWPRSSRVDGDEGRGQPGELCLLRVAARGGGDAGRHARISLRSTRSSGRGLPPLFCRLLPTLSPAVHNAPRNNTRRSGFVVFISRDVSTFHVSLSPHNGNGRTRGMPPSRRPWPSSAS